MDDSTKTGLIRYYQRVTDRIQDEREEALNRKDLAASRRCGQELERIRQERDRLGAWAAR